MRKEGEEKAELRMERQEIEAGDPLRRNPRAGDRPVEKHRQGGGETRRKIEAAGAGDPHAQARRPQQETGLAQAHPLSGEQKKPLKEELIAILPVADFPFSRGLVGFYCPGLISGGGRGDAVSGPFTALFSTPPLDATGLRICLSFAPFVSSDRSGACGGMPAPWSTKRDIKCNRFKFRL
jgi:hypothetical protein